MFNQIREYFKARREKKELLKAQRIKQNEEIIAEVLRKEEERQMRLRKDAKAYLVESCKALTDKGWVVIEKYTSWFNDKKTDAYCHCYATSPEKGLFKISTNSKGGFEIVKAD